MKKSGFIAMVATMMLALGGCGTSANNLGGATDGYGYDNNSYGYNGYDDTGTGYYDSKTGYNAGTYTSSGGAAYWDGYGINSGRPMTDNNTVGNTLGNDVRDVGRGVADAGRDVVNGVENVFDGNTAKVAG